MTQAEYILAAFQAYFPTSEITVDDGHDEMVVVHVVTSTGNPDHFKLDSWSFTAGSDDDRYIFTRDEYLGLYPTEHRLPTAVITVPLMPEEA